MSALIVLFPFFGSSQKMKSRSKEQKNLEIRMIYLYRYNPAKCIRQNRINESHLSNPPDSSFDSRIKE